MMAERTKITGRQLFSVLVLMRLVPITIAFPFMHQLVHVQHAWIGVVLSMLVSLPLVLLITKLGQANPDQTVVQYAVRYLGPVFGRAIGVLIIWYFFIVSVQVARALADAFTVATMPRTPTVVFVIVLTLISANAARHGVEVTARLGESLLVLALVGTIFIALLPYDRMEFDRLLPLFPGNWRNLVVPVSESVAFHCQFILIAMVIPHLDKPQKASTYTLWAVIVGGLAALVVVTSLTVVMGSNAMDAALPTLRLAQMIALGEFIERTESIVMVLWTFVAAVDVAAFIWATTVATKQVLGLKSHQSLVYPFASLAAVFSTIFFRHKMALREYLQKVWTPFSIATIVFVVGAVGISYVIRRLILPRLTKKRAR